MGLNSTNPNLQRTPLHLYLAHNAPPRVIVISVDVTSFTLRREIPDPMAVSPFLRDRELYESLTPIDPDLVLYRWIPLYAFAKTGYSATNQAARGLLGQRRPDMRRDDGFEPNDLAWDGLFEAFVAKNPGGTTMAIEPEAVQAFEDLVSIAARGTARLVLVYPPELAEAHALFHNRAELFQRFHDTASAHGAEFLDYSEHPLTRSREYFYNSAHLNARGPISSRRTSRPTCNACSPKRDEPCVVDVWRVFIPGSSGRTLDINPLAPHSVSASSRVRMRTWTETSWSILPLPALEWRRGACSSRSSTIASGARGRRAASPAADR